jgi:long-chain acyl-CoA synthetase
MSHHCSQAWALDAFQDEYFKTGDLGYFDDDGYLFISGRKKNLIILSDGNNVSPEELEFHFEKLPLVQSVLVADKLNAAGHMVLFVRIYPDYGYAKGHNITDVKKTLEISLNEINASLPAYQNIHDIEIVANDFEKTSLGKIKRYGL